MSQFYKIKEITKLGDPWESHGNKNQTWWGYVEGEELAISVGKQVGNELEVGQSIHGDLMKAVSKKGTEYWKFKSSQVPEGVERPAQPTPIVDSNLEARVKALEDKVFAKTEIKDTYPPVAEDTTDYDTPIDLSSIPF